MPHIANWQPKGLYADKVLRLGEMISAHVAVGGSTSIAVLPALRHFIDTGLTDFPVPLLPEPLVQRAEADQSAEVRRLKIELRRVTEERDILKKAAAYFAKG
ncbi:hypothetical protein XCAW_b00024 (plasmid) [Xanthomonas citri subsp. citri Aw12879]|nr:hypothetical protein XCAW_b00024 [Xanthomonas citri subsp. citri Aw12879]CEE78790.1 hypothetical protein XAC3218_1450002 [Xanthomonas citri pv. citri]